MKRSLLLAVGLSCLTLIGFGLFWQQRLEQTPGPAEPQPTLTILWAKWPPADYLQQLSRSFTAETGIDVQIVQESWSDWQQIFFDEMERKGQRYDMVIGDSQWLGRGADGGHYIELTKWLEQRKILDSMTPPSVTGYAEYPKESSHYWAVPLEGDAMGFVYRKDLFENPNEKQAFEARYGYPLAIPDTWSRLKDIAEFFYRPEQNLYGVLTWVEPHYDGITMGVDALLWAWGAELGDRSNYRVRGLLNSKQGIEALEYYKQLNRYNNPAWANHYLDTDANSNHPMMQGQVAMAMAYFAITPDLLDPNQNPYAADIGFFANPRGPQKRATSLGGQGISLVSYSKNKRPALQFMEWLARDSTQKQWAALGGLTCNKKVLNSPEFLNASPINRPFKESIEMANDFWAVPEYDQLLKSSQQYWYAYVTGQTDSAEQAMNAVAEEWENIFEAAGYYKE